MQQHFLRPFPASSASDRPPETPQSVPLPDPTHHSFIADDCDHRPISERMGDPRLLSAIAMKEVTEIFNKYTALSRGLHSDHPPHVAAARSKMLHTYREEFPELATVLSEDDFDNQANKVFLKALGECLEYIDGIKAGEVLGLFSPWLRRVTRSYNRRVRPSNRYWKYHEGQDDGSA